MLRLNTFLARAIGAAGTLAVMNFTVPLGAMATFAPNALVLNPGPKAHAPFRSRLLSAKEMRSMQGRGSTSPYLVGQHKWDPSYKGVDMATGNYTQSATDLSFENGYGIPVNVTRSYASNNSDEGPLGVGWSISVDVRSTAGGILKSKSAPVMSVPLNFRERPAGDVDPRDANQPVAAVVSMVSLGQRKSGRLGGRQWAGPKHHDDQLVAFRNRVTMCDIGGS